MTHSGALGQKTICRTAGPNDRIWGRHASYQCLRNGSPARAAGALVGLLGYLRRRNR